MNKIITSLDDGHMKQFADYEAHKGLGFQGYERVLYLSLVAALERERVLQDTMVVLPIGDENETDE